MPPLRHISPRDALASRCQDTPSCVNSRHAGAAWQTASLCQTVPTSANERHHSATSRTAWRGTGVSTSWSWGRIHTVAFAVVPLVVARCPQERFLIFFFPCGSSVAAFCSTSEHSFYEIVELDMGLLPAPHHKVSFHDPGGSLLRCIANACVSNVEVSPLPHITSFRSNYDKYMTMSIVSFVASRLHRVSGLTINHSDDQIAELCSIKRIFDSVIPSSDLPSGKFSTSSRRCEQRCNLIRSFSIECLQS